MLYQLPTTLLPLATIPLPKKMLLTQLPLPDFFKQHYARFQKLTPVQQKAIENGLLEGNSLLVCAPTASGKTLIASMAMAMTLGKGKSIYLVPLKALAQEKYKEYQQLLKDTPYRVAMATSDIDSDASYLEKYDLLLLTTEKIDALLRRPLPWLKEVKTMIVDEVHLLNDLSRGPTLEVVITLIQSLIKPQLIALSATIGNPEELASWLKAKLVQDSWRPVELKKGILHEKVTFY